MKRDGQGKRPTRSEPTDLTGPAAAWSASQASWPGKVVAYTLEPSSPPIAVDLARAVFHTADA